MKRTAGKPTVGFVRRNGAGSDTELSAHTAGSAFPRSRRLITRVAGLKDFWRRSPMTDRLTDVHRSVGAVMAAGQLAHDLSHGTFDAQDLIAILDIGTELVRAARGAARSALEWKRGRAHRR